MPDRAALLPVSPHELATRVLRLLAGLERGGQPDPALHLSAFQADAVRRAWRTMRERGGVLIADPVGVGKSWIAAGLIDGAIRDGARAILVTSPAAICAQWHGLLHPLAARHDLCIPRGRRDASSAPSDGRTGLVILSHTALALSRWPAWLDAPDLIVADEAHGFRNPRTRRHAALAHLCRRGRVILLTATPINNSLQDLLVLLRLFLADSALADIGVPSLGDAFATTLPLGHGEAPPLFSRAVAAVVIRRTRARLQEIAASSVRFPIRSPPIPVRWNAPGTGDLIDLVSRLSFAALGVSGPRESRRRTHATGLLCGRIELIRFVLLKRLESGLTTFAVSVMRLHDYMLAFRSALRAGYHLPAAAHRAGRITHQLGFDTLLLAPLPRGCDAERLERLTTADIDALYRIRQLLDDALRRGDPKLTALRELLAGPLDGHKVIIFSEFRDTANYLFSRLAPAGRVALIHGGRALCAAGPLSRLDVVRRFAPVANHAPAPPAHERVDRLIATDVLSEGLNLQDAAIVVSYDLPWNPVRLVQRLGRIDRMGSPHDRVTSCVFLPDRDLEAMLGLLARIRRKLAAIRLGLGAARTRGSRRDRRSLRLEAVADRIRSRDPSLFDDIESADAPVDPLAERLHDALVRIAPDNHATTSDALGIGQTARARSDPSRVLVTDFHATDTILRWPQPDGPATGEPAAGPAFDPAPRQNHESLDTPAPWGVVAVRNGAPAWLIVEQGVVREERDPVLRAMLDGLETSPTDPSSGPRGIASDGASLADAAAALAAATRQLQSGHSAARRPGHPESADTRRVVGSVLSALHATPGGPDPHLCARADEILAMLRAGTRSGIASELRRIASSSRRDAQRDAVDRAAGPADAAARANRLLDRLEKALGAASCGAEPETGESPVVVAMFRLPARGTG